ncbi:MAG: helix-turn-helix domain-containing protein [Eggerthellaceae bacterium]|nr:helix-turn-helix domain-containing protein [Eggerthellaceae bacterium]
MSIGENIRRIREQNGLTQEEFGTIAGVSSMAVSQWENDRAVPRMGAVQRIADHFHVNMGEVIDDVPTRSPASFSEVPLFGRIAAGTPIEMLEADESHGIPTSVQELYPDAFLLQVSGESMNRVLPNGCLALVDPCTEVTRPGKPYAVTINGYDATIKRVRVLEHGYELSPDSTDPTFKPQVYDYGVPGTDEIRILGRVVWHTLPERWEY